MHLVGFVIKKFVSIQHGHTNAKIRIVHSFTQPAEIGLKFEVKINLKYETLNVIYSHLS